MQTKIDRETIIRMHPIRDYLEKRGHQFVKKGAEMYTNCPIHNDSKPSLRVTGNVWYCDPCSTGGSIIDLVSKIDGIQPIEAMQKLSDGNPQRTMVTQTSKPITQPNAKAIAFYQYFNAVGEMVYEVVRYDPKDFRQRRPDGNGGFVYNMNGVMRVLYNLPAVLSAETVWVVEGEKDVESLNRLGFTATCNVGGAGKWMQAYSECLEGKDVIICPDNDKAGQDHATIVRESLAGKVKTLRVISLPKDFKDVSDYIAFCKSDEEAKTQLLGMVIGANVLKKGLDIPILDFQEMEQRYKEFTRNADSRSFDLGKWLPALGRFIRPLVPGELATFVADTGTGKTAILQNLTLKASPLSVLFFEMELPETLMFERYLQIYKSINGEDVFRTYKSGGRVEYDHSKLSHICVCPLSAQDPEQMQDLIFKSELKIGQMPAVVVVDYIGLMQGKGKGRYERLSDAAEAMKRVAKNTNTIVIMASQVARKEGHEISLHDAKDSGSIENSSGLVIGAWRDSDNPSFMTLKILKSTKGGGGKTVDCDFNGEKLQITERVTLQGRKF